MHIRLAHFSGSLIEANDQSCKCIGLKPNEHIPSKLVRSVAGTDLCVVCCLSCVSCLPSNATGCIRTNQTNTCDNCHSQFQHASHFVSIAQSKWLLASGKESYPVQFCMGNKCHTWSAFKLRFVFNWIDSKMMILEARWEKDEQFALKRIGQLLVLSRLSKVFAKFVRQAPLAPRANLTMSNFNMSKKIHMR